MKEKTKKISDIIGMLGSYCVHMDYFMTTMKVNETIVIDKRVFKRIK